MNTNTGLNTNANTERDAQTFAIIGAAMRVHTALGHGFLERVYQEALAIEFEVAGIPFMRESSCEIRYRDRVLACGYIADFVCFGEIIVELKALDELTDQHRSQVLNYLKATKFKRAVLLNLGTAKLQYERIVLNH